LFVAVENHRFRLPNARLYYDAVLLLVKRLPTRLMSPLPTRLMILLSRWRPGCTSSTASTTRELPVVAVDIDVRDVLLEVVALEEFPALEEVVEVGSNSRKGDEDLCSAGREGAAVSLHSLNFEVNFSASKTEVRHHRSKYRSCAYRLLA
jgi:hypothetical protein